MNKFILSIDQGNTNNKVCLFNVLSEDLKEYEILNFSSLQDLSHIIQHYQLDAKNTLVGICSVKSKSLQQNIPFKSYLVSNFYKDSQFLNMPVHYSETLGVDRLVQSWYLFQKQRYPQILIDTGTFTTVDFISEKGLLGGFILPGLESILNCYSNGDQLERLKIEDVQSHFNHAINNNSDITRSTPHCTHSACLSGALLNFLAPINHIIERNLNFEVILTGGNAPLLMSLLKNQNDLQPFASIHFDRNLIHKAIGSFVKKVGSNS